MKKKTQTWINFSAAIFALSTSIITYQLVIGNKTLLERYNLDHMTTVEIIDFLEARENEPKGLKASVTATTLIIEDTKDKVVMAIPDDLFYLSIAPYYENTHPCAIHSLVTCTGELKKESFYVTFEDSSSSEYVYEKTVLSSARGFAGLWLPRNVNGVLSITHQTQTLEISFSTVDSSNTCLTSLRLAR